MTDTTTPAKLPTSNQGRALVEKHLRLGRINYLNMYPMHWALGIEPKFTGVPSEVNQSIINGDIDVACMSSIEYARHADDLLLLPSTCISAEGAVGSIFAISNVAFEDVTDIWVTSQTATSLVLYQLLTRLRGLRPKVHPLEDTPASTLAEHERSAVLLIGDDALTARSSLQLARYVFTDLGERWLSETGMPMVYAVWAVRRDAIERSPEAAAALDQMIVDSVSAFHRVDDAIEQAAHDFETELSTARSYFGQLRYTFGQEERKGLLRFLRMACEEGFLTQVPQPAYIDSSLGELPSPSEDQATSMLAPSPEVVRRDYLRSVGSKRALDQTPEDDRHVEMCLDLEADGRACDVDDVLHRALLGERINEVDALALLQTDRLMDVGQVAHALRLKKTPSADVSFVIDRNINYTNYCITDCGFCAFYRRPSEHGNGGYLHSYETIIEKIRETVELGGTAALLQGGHNPDLNIEWYEDLFRAIKEAYPKFHLHALSPPEIQHISRRSKLSISEVLSRLRDAGMDTLPGGGGEVLIDRVRRVMAPKKTKAGDWLGIMRTAQQMGISTTASLMYGHVELLAERVLHLQGIREVQDEGKGFRAFTSWTFQPGGTPLGALLDAGAAPYQKHLPPTPTAFTYLLTQAVGRIYLDNLENVQSSWVTQGLKVGQTALMFGANDLGSIMIEENVVASAGTTFRATTDDFVHLIKAAGFNPVQRDTLYRTVRSY